MRWVWCILFLIPSYISFWAAVRWYGHRPNTYIAAFLLVGVMTTYNAMRERER